MHRFALFTDSSCDLTPELLSEWGVGCAYLSFAFTDEGTVYLNNEMSPADFYREMRAGRQAKTSAVNNESFRLLFEPALEAGQDLLYIGVSSGISNTYAAAHLAAEQLKERYPERRILTVDSLCASAGLGLLVRLAVEKRAAGEPIEAVARYLEESRLSVCHWFTVDDLVYLKRGGRINPALAFVGGVLGIKPVLHVDNGGRLASVTKARGRRASIRAMAERYAALARDPKEGVVYVSQADCPADAEALVADIRALTGRERGAELTVDIGPGIASHSGPGTLALFFLGRER